MTSKFASGCLIILSAFTFCCSPAKKRTGTSLQPERKKVLIASGNTPYEKEVVKRIEMGLKAADFKLRVVPVQEIEKESSSDYDAILLMDAVENNSLVGPAARFVDSSDPDKKSRIFVSTVTGKKWQFDREIVDGVTGATNMVSGPDVAVGIVKKIRLIIGLPPE